MYQILQKIIDKRRDKINKKGFDFGHSIPAARDVPLKKPNINEGLIICEIKRGSPSEGKMNDIDEPAKWVSDYIEGGANVISVLTEEDFFYGSLLDLMEIKNRYPNISVLRKDFIIYEEELDISFRAGADMVLLIAAMFIDDLGRLKKLLDKTIDLGMMPLLEIHNLDELNVVLPFNPPLIGINSRDLKTFKIDKNYPIALLNKCSENHVIFESGIRNSIDAFFCGQTGFSGILTGTSIVKSGNKVSQISSLKNSFYKGRKLKNNFYKNIFDKIYFKKERIVKVCGITNFQDAECAASNGADILGFIFADSPRKISVENAKKIASKIDNDILKVGVVTSVDCDEVINAVAEGWLDAVQLHGDFTYEKLEKFPVCWYQCKNIKTNDDIDQTAYSPITLFDAFVKGFAGGTGKKISDSVLEYAVCKEIALCLAGGINPENIEKIINKYNPLMLDLSSGLEKAPGLKDRNKIKKFFSIVNSMREIY